MKRILNLSHNDLDGIAAALAIRAAHAPLHQHVTTKFAHYGNIDQLLHEGLSNKKNPYHRIVLSDISFRPQQEKYDSVNDQWLSKFKIPEGIAEFRRRGGELVVLDHHPRVLEVQRQYASSLHPLSICETSDSEGYDRAGSELAYRYFRKAGGYGKIGSFAEAALDRSMKALMTLAGDYDVWRDPLGYGGMLAIGCELMEDPYTALEAMNQAIDVLVSGFMSGEEVDGTAIEAAFSQTILGDYVELASKKLAEESERALTHAVHHGPRITEIHADFFASLIAMKIYQETKGVVVIRYSKDRMKTRRMSLRRHAECSVDFNLIAKEFGGGGHPIAAGINLKDSRSTLDDVIVAIRYALGN